MPETLTATPSAAVAPDGAPLPPPVPSESRPPMPPAAPDGTRRQRILAAICGVALLGAASMGLLWMSATGERDDAIVERDAALSAVAEAESRTETAFGDLTVVRNDRQAALDANDALTAELETARADGSAATARADEVDAALVELEARNAELVDEVTTLESSLDAAEAAAAAAVEDGPAEPATFDIASAPGFARFIGESLASIGGQSVLGDGQHSCLGTAVVNDIGLEAIGGGLDAAAGSAANGTLVDAIERGAISCGIDPSAIF